MNMYIALDVFGNPLGLLLATDMSYAEVAFGAMGTEHYNIEEIDPVAANPSLNVYYILTSKQKQFDHKTSFRKWKRGR